MEQSRQHKRGGEMPSMRNLFKISFIIILFSALGFNGCDNSSEGKLKVRLTDTPYPFDLIEEAKVTISGVKVHVSDSAEVSSGFIDIPIEPPKTFDLMDLQGGVTATLIDASLVAGTYNQIRLIVDSGYIKLKNGGYSGNLTIPSGSKSGIKVFPDPPIKVQDGLTTDLILDFDVSRSFNPIPNGKNKIDDITGFHFDPVIRVVNNSSVGRISGTVYNNNDTLDNITDDAAIEGAAMTALEGTTEVTSTSSQSDGSYVLMGLPEGTYDVRATHPEYEESTRTGVNVTVGNNTDKTDFRLTPQ